MNNSGDAAVRALTCINCGAPLEVPSEATFVTCSHCGSRLIVRSNNSVAYTEALDKLDKRTEHMAQDIDYIRAQNELQLLEREWELNRERFLIRSRDGTLSEPTSTSAVMALAIGMVVFIFMLSWFAFSSITGSFPVSLLVPVLFIFFAMAGLVNAVIKARNYSNAKAEFENQRWELMQKLNAQAGDGTVPPDSSLAEQTPA
jgi:DNA-directed RNA polymerase subunit RPC12/RpoP